MNIKWTKGFLIFSLVVFFMAVFYAAVTFYRLRQPSEPEVVYTVPKKPSVALRKNPPVKKVSKTSSVPDESSEAGSKISETDSPLTEEAREGNLASSDSPLEDTFDVHADEDSETSEYPEVPSGYPLTVIWQVSEEERARMPPNFFEGMVLMHRVMIKLWNQSDHDFVGAAQENGKVYPLYQDVAYVQWDEMERPDGTIYRYASKILTGNKTLDHIDDENIPSGIRIIEYNSAGIDPYEFLSE